MYICTYVYTTVVDMIQYAITYDYTIKVRLMHMRAFFLVTFIFIHGS